MSESLGEFRGPNNLQIFTAKALIYDDGASMLLLARKGQDPESEASLELPGGTVEWGEAPTESLQNSVAAETNLKVSGGEIIGCEQLVTPVQDGRLAQVFSVYWRYQIDGRDTQTSLQVNPETYQGALWIPSRDLAGYIGRIITPDREVLRRKAPRSGSCW